MNYYEHHLGDYVKDTLYLTMVQDGAYRRLLDVYYIKEEPIPLDMKGAYQRARATTKPERDAVAMVLKEFFVKTADGWRHGRCDEEIERYRQKQEAAPVKKENDRERQQRARDRRKALFEELRDYGVTAAWDATTSQLQDALEKVKSQPNNEHVTPPVTPPVTRDNTATQSPVTSNHIKDIAAAANISTTVAVANDSLPSDSLSFDDEGKVQVARTTRYAQLIREWEKERGKFSKVTSGSPYLSVWGAKEVSDQQLREAYDLAVADRELSQDPGAVSAGFIDVFLAKILNPSGGDSALNRTPAPAACKPWQATSTGITEKGAELGIVQGPDELFPYFKERVFAAANMSEEEKSRLRADYGVQV